VFGLLDLEVIEIIQKDLGPELVIGKAGIQKEAGFRGPFRICNNGQRSGAVANRAGRSPYIKDVELSRFAAVVSLEI